MTTPTNSKLEQILRHINSPFRSDSIVGDEVRVVQALQTINKDLMGAIEGLEIDREATEKHIRSCGLPDDETDQAILSMEIDADDRHDTLNDVRKAIQDYTGGGV